MTLICLFAQGLFAMFEMASVSFNKVRLQYFVSQNHRRAKWLSYLINRPALLFGVTLIGVNTSLQLGSECSRRFYDALGLSPDLAPLSQVFLVIILAELAPMFAGRRYPEHVAILGAPLLYLASIILRPIIWIFDLICTGINRLTKGSVKEGSFLTREELQLLFEQREGHLFSPEINTIAANILSLKSKTAKDLMIPMKKVQMLPSFCTVGEMRSFLQSNYVPYLPIYTRSPQHVLGIIYPRDILRLSENKRVKDHARVAWFITEKNSILQILKQFRGNNQSIAVVLDDVGLAVGILTLDEIIDEIFGRSDTWESFGEMVPRMHHVIVDRTFSSDMKIAEFNQKFRVHLQANGAETLEELMAQMLGHSPETGETIRLDQFELTVEEAPLIGPKVISIRTMY